MERVSFGIWNATGETEKYVYCLFLYRFQLLLLDVSNDNAIVEKHAPELGGLLHYNIGLRDLVSVGSPCRAC